MTSDNIRATMYAKLAKLGFKRASTILRKYVGHAHPLVRLNGERVYLDTFIQARKLADKAVKLGLPRNHVFACGKVR